VIRGSKERIERCKTPFFAPHLQKKCRKIGRSTGKEIQIDRQGDPETKS